MLFDIFERECSLHIAKINSAKTVLDKIKAQADFLLMKISYYDECRSQYKDHQQAYKDFQNDMNFAYVQLGGLRDKFFELTGQELEV